MFAAPSNKISSPVRVTPRTKPSLSPTADRSEPVVQRKANACACGGGCPQCDEEKLQRYPAISAAPPGIQRAVKFETKYDNISLTDGDATTVTGTTVDYSHCHFSADAQIKAVGDTEAELKDWDVGILQDKVAGWQRNYWLRANTDKKGRFVEQKFFPVQKRYRDQAVGATTVWDDDSEHTDLSGVAATPAGAKFEAGTTINTSDGPAGHRTTDGADMIGMDASDGTQNMHLIDAGARYTTWISAHNTATDTWRHLRWIQWNYMHSMPFTISGGAPTIGAETWQEGKYQGVGGMDLPLLTGDTANTVKNDPTHWSVKRVNQWS